MFAFSKNQPDKPKNKEQLMKTYICCQQSLRMFIDDVMLQEEDLIIFVQPFANKTGENLFQGCSKSLIYYYGCLGKMTLW